MFKTSYGMFRGRTKDGEREGVNEGGKIMEREKSIKGVNHVNRLLVNSLA